MLSALSHARVDRRRALVALGIAGAGLLSRPCAPVQASPSGGEAHGGHPQLVSQETSESLLRALSTPGSSGRIPAAQVNDLARAEGKPVHALMVALLPLAQKYSRPPLSNYPVGAVVRGSSGSLYLGANIEIAGQALNFAVHAEQSALSNAYMHNEQGVSAIAVTAAPCGHCRQFLTELSSEGEIQVLITGKPVIPLSRLLPMAFGPINLGREHGALPVKQVDLRLPKEATDELTVAALDAARRAYAPYTKALSGVAIQTLQGRIYQGAYIENAAFNPSLPPFETALVRLTLSGEDSAEISKVVLVEIEGASISQSDITHDALSALAASAQLQVVKATVRA